MKNFYKNKNVLVTGGAGFIGSHIVEHLLKHNAKISVLDNLSSGYLQNIKGFLPNINFINDDIRSTNACKQATKNIDVVFHLAALISVPDSVENPKLCYEINALGTKNLLEACTKNNVQNLVFSSSAAIYGNRNDLCVEKDKPNPQSPYAETKLIGEQLCKECSTKCKISTAVLRYFNVFGERQNPDGDYAAVVAKFTQQIKNNRPIIIYGSGKQTRDFINVSNVAKANLFFASQPNLKGEIFNLANGKSINLFELIEQLKQDLKIETVEILFKKDRTGDILNSKANAKKYLNFLSKIDTF
jgi:nucleoside-diphosphate-sugar epimerase